MKTTNQASRERVGRFRQQTIVLGVTGSIAAYKAVSLARRLMLEGAVVQVVMTKNAQRFITPLTFEALTGRPVGTDLFFPSQQTPAQEVMPHLALADSAALLVISPASAHCVAKLAHGLADDVLSTLALAAECPVVVAPAMDGGMWTHQAVRDNVQILRQRGVTVLDPEVGLLASGRTGKGRLPEEDTIVSAIAGALHPVKDFAGRRVLITAGPTQEAIDPIRFISNRSSGKMGWALAEAARDRGAEVILIAGPTALSPLPNVAVAPVVTSEDMEKEVHARFAEADVLIMAAAVSDFRPADPARGKIPKGRGRLALALEPTPDILTNLPPRRAGQCVVGFAAETGDLMERARDKLRRKGLDMIVANNVTEPGAGFGVETNRATLLDRAGRCEALPLMSKRDLAHRILDAVLDCRPDRAQKKGIA